MPENNKKQSTNNRKDTDGKFRSKHIKHDPNAESARAVFGLKEQNVDNMREQNSENRKKPDSHTSEESSGEYRSDLYTEHRK